MAKYASKLPFRVVVSLLYRRADATFASIGALGASRRLKAMSFGPGETRANVAGGVTEASPGDFASYVSVDVFRDSDEDALAAAAEISLAAASCAPGAEASLESVHRYGPGDFNARAVWPEAE